MVDDRAQSAAAGQIRHGAGFAGLDAFWETMDRLDAGLGDFSQDAFGFLSEQIARTREKIRAFEPQVSILGQVKAGKSTLLNALIGQTDLLPADVNPWTSVITGVHLNSRHRPPGTRALFRFFDAHEWDRLIETGGRLGEMAGRAGFGGEAAEIRAQVQQMRQTTEARLGDDFRRLLGQSHAFPEFDPALINRYICYGDPDDPGAEGGGEGVYADLTKTADLYLDLPGFPRGLCLRDTPGVNDTFMMREQITLNAISESRVCVIVLSAHQALSTTDLALLRIICAVEAREVIIFVNRIDELADPHPDMARIRASISRTLQRAGIGAAGIGSGGIGSAGGDLGAEAGIEILFGSGAWANAALSGREGALPAASRAALDAFWADLAEAPAGLAARALEASGTGALHRAIARRITEGPGRAILRDIETEIGQIIEMSETVVAVADRRRQTGSGGRAIDAGALLARLGRSADRALAQFDTDVLGARAALQDRLIRAQQTFTDVAVETLQTHIDTFGESSQWSCDPSSLRMAMRTAFLASAVTLRRRCDGRLEDLMDEVQDCLEHELGIYDYADRLELPQIPEPRNPVLLARTLTLDLGGAWWRKFWRFGARNAAESRYRHLIAAETTPLIEDLLTSCFDPHAALVRAVIESFAADQSGFITALAEQIGGQPGEQSGDQTGGPAGSPDGDSPDAGSDLGGAARRRSVA